MIILPAIDIQDGTCVRLVKGDFATSHKVAEDYRKTAAGFVAAGASWIHMVDLDGARAGEPKNADLFLDVAKNTPLKVELGGGIRSLDTVEAYLKGGISRVILGSIALKNPQIVKEAYRVLDEDGTILAMEKVAPDEETEPVVPASGILEDAGFTDATVRCHREWLCVTGRKPIRSGYSAKLLYISGFITENIRLLAAAVGVIIGVGAMLFTWWKRK